MKEQEKITRQRRIGLGIIQILIVLVAVGLIYRAFVISSENREAPIPQNNYYNIGFEHGMTQAKTKSPQVLREPTNLVHKNQYLKGYREGWDAAQKL